MAQIVADRELRHSIEMAISTARSYIIVVSPYIELDSDMKKAFMKLPAKVSKVIIYRDPEGKNMDQGISFESREFLNGLPKIEFIPVKKLHAKLFGANHKFRALLKTKNRKKKRFKHLQFIQLTYVPVYGQDVGYALF